MAESDSGDPSGKRVPTPGGSTAGLMKGRRPSGAMTPVRLPSMRSRDLTLGGVKKVLHYTEELINYFLIIWLFQWLIPVFVFLFFRKHLHQTSSAEKPKRSKFHYWCSKRQKCQRKWIQLFFCLLVNHILCHGSTKLEGGERRDKRDGNRGRGQRDRGRGRGRPEVIQSHSIFEQGPAEMMMKKRGRGSAWKNTHCAPLWLTCSLKQCNQANSWIKRRRLWKWERCSERGALTHHQY